MEVEVDDISLRNLKNEGHNDHKVSFKENILTVCKNQQNIKYRCIGKKASKHHTERNTHTYTQYGPAGMIYFDNVSSMKSFS